MMDVINISVGFTKVADKFVPHSSKNEQILLDKAQYIVIGNFATTRNVRTNQIQNIRTGLNEDTFYVAVQEFCNRNKLVTRPL